MNEKEQKIADEVKLLAPDAEVSVTLADGKCTVDVTTKASITIVDVIQIIGRIAGLQTKPIVNINK